MDDELDETDLLAAAAKAGETVTHDQLKRWRRAGLVPRPHTERRAGVRGSRAWYPGWASGQLIAVAQLHRSIHRINDLRLALWWDGRWIEPGSLRDTLIAPLERVSAKARAARAGHDDPSDAADAIIAAMPLNGPHSKITQLMSKRLGRRADLEDLLWTFLLLGLGGTPPWKEEDRSIPDPTPSPSALALLAKAAGVERALTDDPAGRGPWLPPDFNLPQFLENLRSAGGFDVEDTARPIRDASDAELAQARADARMFSEPLATIGRAVEGLLGEDIAGLSALQAFAPATAFDRAALIRNMLLLRKLTGHETFDAIAALVGQIHTRLSAIAELRVALPQHHEVLRADFTQRLAALPSAEADRVRSDIAEYLREHPQIARDLSDESRE